MSNTIDRLLNTPCGHLSSFSGSLPGTTALAGLSAAFRRRGRLIVHRARFVVHPRRCLGAALPPKPPDHYSPLQLFRDASPEQLKKRRSLTEHPDKGGTEARFRALEAAYRVLSDPARRAAYEQDLARWENHST